MLHERACRWKLIFACVLVGAALCPWIRAGDDVPNPGAPIAPVKNAVSDRVIVNDVIYRLEWKEGLLFLVSQSLTSVDRHVNRIDTDFRAKGAGTVSQIVLTSFKDRGLIAAMKITGPDKAEFVEMAMWRRPQEKEINGRWSAFTFLSADKSYNILALSSRGGRGIYVVVGKESWAEGGDDQTTDGFLFYDGCPWPCMGGRLSRFKGKSLPIDETLPFSDTKELHRSVD